MSLSKRSSSFFEILVLCLADAFLCAFQLAWQLSNELSDLDEERSVLADEAERSVPFLSGERGGRQ